MQNLRLGFIGERPKLIKMIYRRFLLPVLDDIFAEAAATAKPTKVASDTQKPVSETKSKEDYDNIFEDPLNVLRK